MKPIPVLFALAVSLAASTPVGAETPWEAAQRAFDDYQDARAADILRRSAEAGDPQAQKVYGLMLRFGTSLFPTAQLSVNRPESLKWIDRAAKAEMAAGGIAVLDPERR